MSQALLSRIDGRLGQGIESAIRGHHRRRLRRVGRLEQLDPRDGGPWAAGGSPPRDGNELEILIDGERALGAIAQAVREARESVAIAGWHLTPAFGLTRDEHAMRLRDLLGELAQRLPVRVLMWAGAPVPLFHPTRAEAARVRDELVRGTRVRCALDARERPLHCHHEKLVIVDGVTAFVGGIDLTSFAGDRWDTSEHPLRPGLGWHDTASRLRGPAVADVAAHFAARWSAVTGERLDVAAGAAAGGTKVQFVRTVPERVYPSLPHGEFGILESYVRALRRARTLVYLESQFLWSPELVAILAEKLRNPPSDDFRLLVVLPSRPNNGADSTHGQLGVLADADDGGRRFLAVTLTTRTGALSGPLYVHSKLAIVDDEWLTVGSANLNDHSLFNDTEVNLVTCDERLARRTRLALWAEHLERPAEELEGPPARVVDQLWRPIAREQLERHRRGDPATHRLLELPGVSRRSKALLGPLDGLLVDG